MGYMLFVTLCIYNLVPVLCDSKLAIKLNGIDDQVNIIQAYPDHPEFPINQQSVQTISDKGAIYYIRGGDDRIFQDNDVPFPITHMYTYQEDCGKRKSGDIFFSTTNGLYLRRGGAEIVSKIDEIIDPVIHMQQYPDEFCTLHLITNNGDVFNITGANETVFKQTDVPFPVTTMFTFTKDGGYHKTGDIYYGTTFGVYFRKVNESLASRIDDIFDSVALIQEYWHDVENKGRSVHVVTKSGDIYHIKDAYEGIEKETDVPFPVKTMYTFMEDCGNRRSGDIYFGTTYGVYLRKADEKYSEKINGIDEPVKFFQEYTDIYCSFHVVSESGEIYKIRAGDKTAIKQTDVPLPIITMHTFSKDGGNRRMGDIYFGTTNGVYLRRVD